MQKNIFSPIVFLFIISLVLTIVVAYLTPPFDLENDKVFFCDNLFYVILERRFIFENFKFRTSRF